jgi:hypothetical protein
MICRSAWRRSAITGRTVEVNLGVVPSGGSAVVTISARHGFAGSFSNSPSVAAAQADPNPGNNTAAVSTTATAPQDIDSDGIPDWWEALNISSGAPFTDFGDLGATGDFDGDGVRNLDEWLADTPGNDRNSFLRIADMKDG